MAPSAHSSRRQTIAGIVILLLIFGGCSYRLGYPWNCKQAQEALSSAQAEFAEAARAGDLQLGAARQQKVNEAESKRSQLCN